MFEPESDEALRARVQSRGLTVEDATRADFAMGVGLDTLAFKYGLKRQLAAAIKPGPVEIVAPAADSDSALAEDLRYRIAGLHLRHGDVLVIKSDQKQFDPGESSRISKGLESLGIRNRVLLLSPDMDVSVMTSEELNKRVGPPLVSITTIMLAMFDSIDQDHRSKIFMELDQIFCKHCGRRHADSPRGRCQCWNDE